MSRFAGAHPGSRLAMGGVVTFLCIVSLLPAGWLGIVGWFSNVVETLVVPVQYPVTAATGWLFGKASEGGESAELRDAREQAVLFRTLYLQTQDENARLRDTIDDLTAGRALGTGRGVVQVPATVIGFTGVSGSQIVKLRAGTDQGVAAGDVATIAGVHILGRVMADLDSKFCRVQLLVDKASGGANLEGRGRITGVIMPGEVDARAPVNPAAPRVACLLAPTGGLDGRLTGDVVFVSGAGAGGGGGERQPQITVGSLVRLSDDRWPDSAQMLILGRVERVDSKPNQRQSVTVAPVYDLRTIREAVVRVSADAAPTSGGSGGGGS